MMVEHVAHMGEKKGAYRVLVGKSKRKNHLEDPGLDGGYYYDGWSEVGMGHGLD
jgi:hypothetical protein